MRRRIQYPIQAHGELILDTVYDYAKKFHGRIVYITPSELRAALTGINRDVTNQICRTFDTTGRQTKCYCFRGQLSLMSNTMPC
jgi:hypothetical protein